MEQFKNSCIIYFYIALILNKTEQVDRLLDWIAWILVMGRERRENTCTSGKSRQCVFYDLLKGVKVSLRSDKAAAPSHPG